MTSRFGLQLPSSETVAPPRARKRPPNVAIDAPTVRRYSAYVSGSVTSMSAIRYAAIVASSTGFSRAPQRGRVHGVDFVMRRHRDVEVAQQTVVQSVDPAVDGQFLSTLPGVANDRRLADVQNLLDHVELAQPLGARGIGQLRQVRAMLVAHVLDVP